MAYRMKITKADVGRTVKLRDGAIAVITDVRPSYMHRYPVIVRRESDGYVMEVGENGRFHSQYELEENEDIIEFLQPRDEQPPASDNVNHPPHYTSHPSGIEYRPEWWDSVACGRGVTQIACDVMATIRGSCDRSRELQQSDIRALRWVIENWKEPEDAFDNAVHYLISGAISEYEDSC